MTNVLEISPLPSGGTFRHFRDYDKTPRPLGEQGVIIDADDKYSYLLQTKSGKGDSENGYVHRYDSSGKLLDTMYLPGAGHLTAGAEYQGNIIVNYNVTNASGNVTARKLAMIPYQPGKTVKVNDPSVKALPTVSKRYAVPSLSPDNVYLLTRETNSSGDTFNVYDFRALLTSTTKVKPLKTFEYIKTSARAFQGIAISGPYVYILYGHTNGLAAHRDNKFDHMDVDVHDWTSKTPLKVVQTRNYQKDLLDWNKRIETEPAGIQIHPTHGLIFGQKLDYHVDSERYVGLFVGAEWRTLTINGKAYEPVEDVSVEVLNDARATGNFSRHVYYMQEWLRKNGYDPGPSDGYWHATSKTQAALDAFRWDHRTELRFTDRKDGEGTIGPLSLSLLNDLARSSMKIREEKK